MIANLAKVRKLDVGGISTHPFQDFVYFIHNAIVSIVILNVKRGEGKYLVVNDSMFICFEFSLPPVSMPIPTSDYTALSVSSQSVRVVP
jgi:hypothetical protein